MLYVTFQVEVANSEWSYNATKHGKAEVKIQVSRSILDDIDPGNLFIGALQAALAEYDAPSEPEEKEEMKDD